MESGLNVMVGGEAGQGVQSAGFMLAKAFALGGLSVFADQDYESRVRGGHNFFRVRAGPDEVGAISEKLDILLALNEESVQLHRGELTPDGIAIFDGEKTKGLAAGGNLVSAPLSRLAQDRGGSKVMANTVAVGVGLGLAGYPQETMVEAVHRQFGTGESGGNNVRAATAGYEYASTELKGLFKRPLKTAQGETSMLLNGNEAVALGAIAAGCTFMAAYPMTPATPIMEFLAGKSRELGLAVIQPEDEIAAMTMTIGAAFAGARAMTATSGSGFALMVEGLGLAGITETPIVVVLAQRPAPAVGLPTRTEQGDLQFVLTAAPGEFPRAVLAPATVEDAFWLTVKAFNLADKYQLPVILLTDHHLASSYATVPRFDLSRVVIDRGQLLSAADIADPEGYKRHKITPSGISPRALPSQGKALVVTDADEHDEDGHLIEDAEMRTQMMLKRLRKQDGLKGEVDAPPVYGPAEAETILLGWGSTYGALREATDMLRQDGLDANLLHLSELWPFPAEAVARALQKAKRSVVVESNATGQLARLIRSETGIKASGSILKFDGRPFSPADIVSEVRKEIT